MKFLEWLRRRLGLSRANEAAEMAEAGGVEMRAGEAEAKATDPSGREPLHLYLFQKEPPLRLDRAWLEPNRQSHSGQNGKSKKR